MENRPNPEQGRTVASTPLFKGILKRAEEYIKSPLRIKQLLNDTYQKASEKKDFGSIAHEVWENLQTLSRLIKASVTGDYNGVPTSTLVGGVAVFLYFLTPIDFVPDFIPVIGLLDDVSLLAWFMTSIKGEMEKFAEWEANGSVSHNLNKATPAASSRRTSGTKALAAESEPLFAEGQHESPMNSPKDVKHIPAKKNPIEENPAEEHATKRAASSGSGEPNVRASTTDSTRIPSKGHDDATAGGNVR